MQKLDFCSKVYLFGIIIQALDSRNVAVQNKSALHVTSSEETRLQKLADNVDMSQSMSRLPTLSSSLD